MTPKPEIFRYVTELDTCIGSTPTFDDAMPFHYDTFQHGTPTAFKLAKVAARVEIDQGDGETLGVWSGKPIRFWFWSGNGETFYGSIEVALDWEPTAFPIGDTVQRAAEAAA